MIFAETDRLILRALEKSELTRLVELLGEWDVVRWLSVVPFPYTMRDAEEFYDDVTPHNDTDEPQFFALALKRDNVLVGGVGLHAPRTSPTIKGEVEIGYWLAKEFWGQGLMSEATRAVIDIAFERCTTAAVGATTEPENMASQKVLQNAGLRNLGLIPRTYKALRGGDQVLGWHLTREEYFDFGESLTGAA
jgi:8-oxo-dGTP diphosphatase